MNISKLRNLHKNNPGIDLKSRAKRLQTSGLKFSVAGVGVTIAGGVGYYFSQGYDALKTLNIHRGIDTAFTLEFLLKTLFVSCPLLIATTVFAYTLYQMFSDSFEPITILKKTAFAFLFFILASVGHKAIENIPEKKEPVFALENKAIMEDYIQWQNHYIEGNVPLPNQDKLNQIIGEINRIPSLFETKTILFLEEKTFGHTVSAPASVHRKWMDRLRVASLVSIILGLPALGVGAFFSIMGRRLWRRGSRIQSAITLIYSNAVQDQVDLKGEDLSEGSRLFNTKERSCSQVYS